MSIKVAQTDKEIERCYSVMVELRPHLSAEEFFSQVKRQMNDSNFKLVYLDDNGVKAVGGIRVGEWLSGGKHLEIEDLVVLVGERSKGYGGVLFDWIVGYAKRENCAQGKLVSHVKRFGAHRFYLGKRMSIEAHYFSLPLR